MSLVIPDEIVQATGMSSEQLLQEFALLLYQKEKLTLAQAAYMAGMNRIEFQQLMSSKDIPIHYDIHDFEADLETLRRLGRL